mgnify:CR=1 FL=1
MSVDIHLSNPLCKGWFSAAIMMSGGGLQRFLAKPLTPEKARAFWEKIVENAGCKSIAELKKADKEVLYRAGIRRARRISSKVCFTPCRFATEK